jgi:hypothetical protein
MAEQIDKYVWKIEAKYMINGSIPIKFMKRFLDDIFLIFTGSTVNLHKFFEELNTLHPTIKFTMSHTTPRSELQAQSCECVETNSIPFLDTQCQIKEGRLITDLYRKPTDRNQYLLPSSCHPIEVKNSIPFSLCLRIVRACSEPEDRESRFLELKTMLLSRSYTPGILDAAIAKARATPRLEAL